MNTSDESLQKQAVEEVEVRGHIIDSLLPAKDFGSCDDRRWTVSH